MPAVTPHSNALILVSGAAGFIATHIIQQLLESGYRVRGTVRSEEKTPYLKSLFEKFGDALEVMIVPDITKVCSEFRSHNLYLVMIESCHLGRCIR
jgi:nucleoside-diphosphate-sugar epimerase